MTKIKIEANQPSVVSLLPVEILGSALDGTEMLAIVFDDVPYVISYKLARKIAKTIQKIIKAKIDGQA